LIFHRAGTTWPVTSTLRTRIMTGAAALACLVALTYAIDSTAAASRGGLAAPNPITPASGSSSGTGADPTFENPPSGSSDDPSSLDPSSSSSSDPSSVDPSSLDPSQDQGSQDQGSQGSQDQAPSVDPGFAQPSSGTS
jgi:hypothetical protein